VRRMSPSRASENDAVWGTLLSEYTNPLIREARERQDELLIRRFRGQPLTIADLGCGDGYHAEIFAAEGSLYHGYEISPDLARLARDRWRSAGLDNCRLILGDLVEATPEASFYDLAWCLYFTPGNLRGRFDDLARYDDAYLDANPVFIRIVERFHAALKPGGSMFLTVYKDVPEAEAAQVDFYINTNQHPITAPGSRFVATAEGFWSARWTRASMLSNLERCRIAPAQVLFHELNRIAWLVEIER
jgi:protein-L-isoaspartate O-methyltransferase